MTDLFNFNLQQRKSNDSEEEKEEEKTDIIAEIPAPKKNIVPEKCSYCKKNVVFYDKFSCDSHKICSECLYKKIFCHNLEDITKSENETITVKCDKCNYGEMKKSLKEIYELIKNRLEDYKKGEVNAKNANENVHCEKHPELRKKYYCTECNTLVCSYCGTLKDADHYFHRLIKATKMKLFLKKSINHTTLRLPDQTSFLENLDLIGNNVKSFVDTKFFNGLKTLDDLVKSAISIRNEFQKEFNSKLTSKLYIVKILKLFYMDYFIHKDNILYENNINNLDIDLLKYISDINQEFIGFTIHFDSLFNNKINEIKSQIEAIKKKINSFFNYQFVFSQTPRNYIPDEILPTKLTGNSNILLAQTYDDCIVTGGNFRINFFEEISDEIDINYKYNYSINKMVGDIKSMIVLRDNRIITAAETSIKVWEKEGNTYKLNHTLSGHLDNVTCLANFSKERFISGSTDKSVIIWRPVDKTFIVEQILQIDDVPSCLLGCKFNDIILAAMSNGGISCYKKMNEMSGENNNVNLYNKHTTLTQHKGRILALCELDENHFASGGNNPKLIIWKIEKGEISFLSQLKGHKSDVTSIVKLLDGSMATGSCDHTIIIWKLGNLNRYIPSQKITESDRAIFKLIQLKDERLCSLNSNKDMIIWKKRNIFY